MQISFSVTNLPGTRTRHFSLSLAFTHLVKDGVVGLAARVGDGLELLHEAGVGGAQLRKPERDQRCALEHFFATFPI